MDCIIRRWKKEDAFMLAEAANNQKVQDNLRALPFPYTVADAHLFIDAALKAEADKSFSFAIVVDGEVAGSIGVFRADNIHFRTGNWDIF